VCLNCAQYCCLQAFLALVEVLPLPTLLRMHRSDCTLTQTLTHDTFNRRPNPSLTLELRHHSSNPNAKRYPTLPVISLTVLAFAYYNDHFTVTLLWSSSKETLAIPFPWIRSLCTLSLPLHSKMIVLELSGDFSQEFAVFVSFLKIKRFYVFCY